MLEFVFNEVVSHLRVSGYDKVLFSSSAKFCYREWAALVLAGVEGSGVCVCVCGWEDHVHCSQDQNDASAGLWHRFGA